MAHDKFKDERESPAAGRDEGRRMYLSERPYQEQIRDKTRFAFDTRQTPSVLEQLHKHSEALKPYQEPEYEEMEYLMPPWWQFPPWWDDFDLPWYDAPIISGPPSGALRVLFCDIDGCFCLGETTCLPMKCSHQAIDVRLDGVSSEEDFAVSIGKDEICITSREEAPPFVEVAVKMITPEGVVGEHASIQILACFPDDPLCGCTPQDSSSMVCSGGGDIIPGGLAKPVTITGGTPPFSWHITGGQHGGPGGGWTLDFAETLTGNNVVRCANTPNDCCGCASVGVTDGCGRVLGVHDPPANKCFFKSIGTSHFVHTPGDDDYVEFWCSQFTWGNTNKNQPCSNPCYRHTQVKQGGWIVGGNCPSTCLCANFFMIHPNTEAGCSFNCTYQVDARNLGKCTLGLSIWVCT